MIAFHFYSYVSNISLLPGDHLRLSGSHTRGSILISRLVFFFINLHRAYRQSIGKAYRQSIAPPSLHRSLYLFSLSKPCARICIEMKTFPFDRHLHCRGLLSLPLPLNGRSLYHEFVHIRHSRSVAGMSLSLLSEVVSKWFLCFTVYSLQFRRWARKLFSFSFYLCSAL